MDGTVIFLRLIRRICYSSFVQPGPVLDIVLILYNALNFIGSALLGALSNDRHCLEMASVDGFRTIAKAISAQLKEGKGKEIKKIITLQKLMYLRLCFLFV